MTERMDRRAVTLLLLGLCSLIGSGIFFASVPATLSEARAVADANVCHDSARRDADCLVRETGRLSGPYSTRRDPGDDWVFQPGGSVERERFGLDPLASQRAEYLPDTVTVLRWHGETVAVETEDGRRIETEGFRGSVANQFYLGLMALGAAGMFVTSGFVVRRSADGWTVRPRDPTYARRETPLPMQVALVVAALGGAGMFTIAMGGSTSLSITIALIPPCVGGAMAVRTRLRCRRHR